ncbi:MAG: hypothetical protein ASARMPREDX12_004677 [Alectoria sarmentosa]|nr:MAG: hypothetical protein ASARMPREDX12_004677 [Alectoria sarmentosa]
MHTMILNMIALLLPLLATAEETDVWSPPVWPPVLKQPYYSGDVLNITKCYCESLNEENKFGHYYQFDFRSYHNEQEYTLAWPCDLDATTTASGMIGAKRVTFPVSVCWNAHDLWRKKKEKQCSRSYNGDTFCYELGNTRDPHDYYYFNGQKRILPNYGNTDFPPDQCVALCRDKVDGKAVASDTEGGWEKSLPSLDKKLTTLKSSFQSYTNLDDVAAN